MIDEIIDLGEALRRQSVRHISVRRIGPGALVEDDVVATEEPLEIRLGYTGGDGERTERSLSVTMRTPGKDQELALGFLYTEGIIRTSGDVLSVGPCGPPAANGLINVVRVELAPGVAIDLDRLERHFYTSSSCGVCGKSSIEAVAVQSRYDLHDARFKIAAEVLGRLPEALRAEQAVFEQTGGLHASGLFDAEGRIELVREDVGRHNALDKLIGNRLTADALPLEAFGILVSGRTSFELVQKAMMAGCPLLAAVGAPSSLAVELADEFGMTLVGFLKPDRFNVYSRPDRIV
ncbi:MAG TPA: formate dehydrogenase accessory sulfurtransferase FdhD [Gammaproteobacteria bacterium]|nr:formate dehydrogenase accessory sulfurtransferase FdhD [Gammaproteobacteria bacterium]